DLVVAGVVGSQPDKTLLVERNRRPRKLPVARPFLALLVELPASHDGPLARSLCALDIEKLLAAAAIHETSRQNGGIIPQPGQLLQSVADGAGILRLLVRQQLAEASQHS